MHISKELKQKLFRQTRKDLLQLAEQANNLDAFKALDEEENFAKASKLLGLEDEFNEYIKIATNPDKSSNGNITDLIENYHHFLMAKICFPEAV
ncbi:MAG: hypothetical protein AAGF87_04080 [Bacteroidota bacterium]